jgi:hypothetical protein
MNFARTGHEKDDKFERNRKIVELSPLIKEHKKDNKILQFIYLYDLFHGLGRYLTNASP